MKNPLGREGSRGLLLTTDGQNEHLRLVFAFTIVSRATNYGLRGGIFVFVCIFGHLEKRGMDENCWHHITGGDLVQ